MGESQYTQEEKVHSKEEIDVFFGKHLINQFAFD